VFLLQKNTPITLQREIQNPSTSFSHCSKLPPSAPSLQKKQVDKSSINLSIIDGQIWSHWIISTFGVEKISAKEVWCYNRKSQRNFRKDGS